MFSLSLLLSDVHASFVCGFCYVSLSVVSIGNYCSPFPDFPSSVRVFLLWGLVCHFVLILVCALYMTSCVLLVLCVVEMLFL